MLCSVLGDYLEMRSRSLNVKDAEKERKHFLSNRGGTIAHCWEEGIAEKQADLKKSGFIFYSFLFILRFEALWELDVQFLECVSLSRGRFGASRACSFSSRLLIDNARVTGCLESSLCSCESSLSPLQLGS